MRTYQVELDKKKPGLESNPPTEIQGSEEQFCASQPLVDIQNYGDADGDPRFVVTRKIGGTAPHSDN